MLDNSRSVSDELLSVLIAPIESQNRGFLKKSELLDVVVVKVEILLESAHLMHVIERLLRLSSLHGFETLFLQRIYDFLVLRSRWLQILEQGASHLLVLAHVALACETAAFAILDCASGHEWFVGLLRIDFTFDSFLHLVDCGDLGLQRLWEP